MSKITYRYFPEKKREMRNRPSTTSRVACAIVAFSHPTRPGATGKLVRFTTTGAYAIVSGRTLTRVPAAWAEAQAARLRVTAPTPECAT